MEDTYEINNSRETAYNLSNFPRTWLSEIGGLGFQNDDDWFKIAVEPGFERLAIDLQFIHAEGDIDLEVVDENGNFVIDSASATDNEYINTILPNAGTYYLNVNLDNAGNSYDLWWDSLEVIDDTYEINNFLEAAYDLSNHPQTWLSELSGLGVQNDDDWFKISLEPGSERLVAELQFSHEQGDIDLTLFDENGEQVAESVSETDNENINIIVPDAGDYYLNVNLDNAGNSYDLWWDSVEIVDDTYEFNDSLASAYDISNDPQTWLSEINGLGIQNNDDWFKIFVESGSEELIVDLQFSHQDGDIDLEVIDKDGNLVNIAESLTDNEFLDTLLPSPGTYYLNVNFNNLGNTYNLKWQTIKPDLDIKGIGDFNLDFQSDVVWRNSTTGKNFVVFMDNNHRLESISLNSVANTDWDIKGAGDFNGDRQSDLIWRNEITGKNSVWLMDGTNRLASVLLNTVPKNWDISGAGDFNQDGKSDLIWRDEITGKNSVWLMDGTNRLASIPLNSVANTDWDIKGAGDFNGDGQSDLVWRNEITGKNSVWLMDGTNRLASIPLNSVANTDWDIKGTGDFNEDGQSDLVWRNEIAGKNSVWLMDGTNRLESISLDSI